MTKTQKRALALDFLSRNDLELQHSMLLLGGSPALWRLQRLRRALSTAPHFDTSHRRGLRWLYSLLSQEIMDHEDCIEHVLDPADPAIHTVCLLSERCADVLDRLGAPGDAVLGADSASDAA